jgi:hypothetical protein
VEHPTRSWFAGWAQGMQRCRAARRCGQCAAMKAMRCMTRSEGWRCCREPTTHSLLRFSSSMFNARLEGMLLLLFGATRCPGVWHKLVATQSPRRDLRANTRTHDERGWCRGYRDGTWCAAAARMVDGALHDTMLTWAFCRIAGGHHGEQQGGDHRCAQRRARGM